MKPYAELKFVFPDNNFYEINQFFGQHLNGRPAAAQHQIYFDSAGLKLYRQMCKGKPVQYLLVETNNKKRTDSDAFLILKRFGETRNEEFKAPVLYGNIPDLLETGNTVAFVKNDPFYPTRKTDVNRFLFHYERDHLKPKVEVVYDRKVYADEANVDLEICLNRNIRGRVAHRGIKCSSDKKMMPLLAGKFMVTIKFCGEMPNWLIDFIQQPENRSNLTPADFSKYQMAIREFCLPSPVRKMAQPRRAALALVQAVLPASRM